MIVLLIQPEVQSWPPRLRWHERVMVKVPVQEISVRMLRLRFFPDPRKGGDRFTSVYGGDIHSGDQQLVVGDPGPVYIQGWAELIQTLMK